MDEIGLDGGEGGAIDSGAPAVIYELDSGSPESASPPAAGSLGEQPASASSAPAAPPDPRDVRIAALERQNAEMAAEWRPYLAHLQAEQRRAQQPQWKPEDFDDPSKGLRPSQLYQSLQNEVQRQAQLLAAHTEATARATMSEQAARGQFNEATLGKGNDYESLVNRYVAPLVQENPAIEQLLRMAAPNDPAAGKMIFATIVACIDRAGGDLVKGLKGALEGITAYQQGAREAQQQNVTNARAASRRVLSGSATGAARPGVRRLETAEDVWNLPASEFDRMWNQPGAH